MTLRSEGIASRLREARERLDVSGRKLSIEAGLASTASHGIEMLGRMPGIDTCEMLAGVLGVSPSWLAYGAEPLHRVYNFQTAPGFDGLRRAAEADAAMRSSARINHSQLYADPLGAGRYMELSSSYRGLPLKQAATAISGSSQEALSLVALGAGHARHEAALAEHLTRTTTRVDIHGEPSLELFLIDSSVCMLSEGNRYATNQLSRLGIPVTAIEGDFSQMASFCQIFAPRGPRRRVFTLLGYTFGNLDNESVFLCDALACAARGDLLLVDYLVATIDPNTSKPDEILRDEPITQLLASGATPTTSNLLAFLAGPVLRRYGGLPIKMSTQIGQASGAIPKSFSVEVVASVDQKRFITASYRRYDTSELVRAFEKLGWRRLGNWGFDPERPSDLALFQRGT